MFINLIIGGQSFLETDDDVKRAILSICQYLLFAASGRNIIYV